MGHKRPDILLIIALVVVLGAAEGSFISDVGPSVCVVPKQAGIMFP